MALLAAMLIASSCRHAGAPIKPPVGGAIGARPRCRSPISSGCSGRAWGGSESASLIVELGRGPEPDGFETRSPARCATRRSSSATGSATQTSTWTSTGSPFRRSDCRRAPSRSSSATAGRSRRSSTTPALERGPGPARRRLQRRRARARQRASPCRAARPARRDERLARPASSKPADTERRRLERNLHDGAQQRLVTLALHLRMAQETLHDDPPAAGGDARGRRRRPQASARRAPRARPRAAPRRPHRPRPRTRAAVTREPRARSRSRSPASRPHRLPEASRSGPLLRRRREPHQRREARRSVRSEASNCQRRETVVVEIRDNGSGGANLPRLGDPRARRPRRGARRPASSSRVLLGAALSCARRSPSPSRRSRSRRRLAHREEMRAAGHLRAKGLSS